MISWKGVKLSWLGHDGFKIVTANDVIAIDPYKISVKSNDKASVLFITHEHFDHCSPSDIRKVIDDRTIVIAPEIARDCLRSFDNEKIFVKPGERYNEPIPFETVPAYNVNKFRAPGVVFHPKEDGRVGYVIDVGFRLYHAGDTDFVPEMRGLEAEVALLPVSGTYVMTPEEAAEAVKSMKGVKLAVPMHWGTIVGSVKDALKFKELVEPLGIEVIVPEREAW
ncbi:metal dependent hydrolase [Ignicoccus islandicus DSM 13165]|uniref:Metal dependent hydrolase n=1 Tax=Ignicoccus islandicus DSM 13165 TaxID=940295 RepID=A0A0U3FPF8_9CREN|nr:MBL fold metallo-hydrolase [Ignicoccus islandicus]ALU11815.1 metal dependent hydrolase [Ignicoccus islandicus DSM 13165]